MKTKETALVIMAAGIGSRFGGGIKQLEPVGPGGEIIMDYSIQDAREAGFDKVIFIIRRDLEKDFREIIGDRIGRTIRTEYVFQELDNLPDGFHKPSGRTKPWGTGQALLSCRGKVKDPFCVINADDYYGKEAFVKIHDYLTEAREEKPYDFCMAGFALNNTLSDNGPVTRGICTVNNLGSLTAVTETFHIERQPDGRIVGEDRNGNQMVIDEDSRVSMNLWGLTPGFLDDLESGFRGFLAGLSPDDVKSEYLLPAIVDDMVKGGKARVSVLETGDRWFGVTYMEDKKTVVESIRQLIAQGLYSSCGMRTDAGNERKCEV